MAVIARSVSDEAIQTVTAGAVWIASLALAMTLSRQVRATSTFVITRVPRLRDAFDFKLNARFSGRSGSRGKTLVRIAPMIREEGHMERRYFLKLAGFAAGAALLAASAQAAPLAPAPIGGAADTPAKQEIVPAVTTEREVDQLKPQQVRWGHGHHYGWHHRHWGWHHRHWGWHHRWHRHHWHRHGW